MSARKFVEPYPYVSTDAPATDAAQLLAEHKLPAPLVVDRDGLPYAIVPGSQLIGQLVPEYALEDPSLSALVDDRDLDEVPRRWPGSRSPSGCRAAGSGRRRSAPTRASCTSQH
ncbi:hypothetical protein [Streptomyces sp. UG1]|uniref:hypothetical protein n=1 Tax=Streptomyces sp. UG1 TaxID=3417652 RepID=UPI003CF7A9E9